MPDREVKTVRDIIYYQYAKVIARSAFKEGDGKAAKAKHYGFIKQTFRALKSGEKKWSDVMREDWQLVEGPKACAYCSETTGLCKEHIVPRSLRIKPECASCDTIQGIHNQVWACSTCNSAKGAKGLYQFFKARNSDEKKYYDLIPPILEKKYLKAMFMCHQCAGTLDRSDPSGDGELTVVDIDTIVA